MPTLRQSTQVARKDPVISADGYEPITIVGDYITGAALAASDVVEMVILPAGYVPVDAILATESLDSDGTPAITLDMGLISGTAGAADNARTCGNEAFAASAVGQAGGIARPTKASFALIAPTDADRGFGVKIGTAADVLVTGAKIRLTLLARPAIYGV
ncbi:MAG: hypothetical protein KF686_03380 [Ramlibacter sp.]|nr:hypothetical protein [Ramlibacter sp.]